MGIFTQFNGDRILTPYLPADTLSASTQGAAECDPISTGPLHGFGPAVASLSRIWVR